MTKHPARPRKLKGWGTVKALTEQLGFPSEHAYREWLSPAGVPSVWRGRVIRYLPTLALTRRVPPTDYDY